MKRYITALFILLCATGHAQQEQKPDSVRVTFDKNGNIHRKVYYSTPKKDTVPADIKIQPVDKFKARDF